MDKPGNLLLSERGSALVYIFIGIVLFGALMFMYAKSSNQNTTGVTNQQNTLSASSLIEQGRALETTTQKLIAKGCSESQLSFDPPPYTANTNANAPADMHCHVFHIDGGRLNAASFSGWAYSSASAFPSVGTGSALLAAYFQGIDSTSCQKINDLLNNGLTTIPSMSGAFFSAAGFDGTFTATPVNLTPATGITSGCTGTDTHTPNVFFKALIVR